MKQENPQASANRRIIESVGNLVELARLASEIFDHAGCQEGLCILCDIEIELKKLDQEKEKSHG